MPLWTKKITTLFQMFLSDFFGLLLSSGSVDPVYYSHPSHRCCRHLLLLLQLLLLLLLSLLLLLLLLESNFLCIFPPRRTTGRSRTLVQTSTARDESQCYYTWRIPPGSCRSAPPAPRSADRRPSASSRRRSWTSDRGRSPADCTGCTARETLR